MDRKWHHSKISTREPQVIHTSCNGKMIDEFPSLLFCIFAFIVHHLVYNQVLLFTGNDVKAQSPLGGAESPQNLFILQDSIWLPVSVLLQLCVHRAPFRLYLEFQITGNSVIDFLIVFQSNSTFIVRRFRDSDVLLQTGDHGMVISPLRGAVHSFLGRLPKGLPWLPVCLQL